jgi:hypothetical protein
MQIGKIQDTTDEKEIAKRTNQILELQMGGWLVESHCWNLPDNDNIKTCKWCGMRFRDGMVVSTAFPMCEENPILNNYIIKLIEKGEKDEP